MKLGFISHPACNKTSLSRKPCIQGKKLLWNAISKSWSLRIRHEKSPESPPGGEIAMTSYPACHTTSLSWKPCIQDNKIHMELYIRKSWSLFQNASCKIAWSAPCGEITMTSYSVGNKTSLSQKPCIKDKQINMEFYQEVMVALSECVI